MKVTDFDVSKIKVADRQKRPLGDIDGLVNSIQDVGLLHPIVVGTDGQLKVGYRRLVAHERLRRETIPAHVTDNLDNVYTALRAERDENVQREKLPPSVMVERARELHKEEEKQAKKRQRLAGISNLPTVSGGNFPPLTNEGTGKTRDKVASAFGVSGKTYEKAKQIVDAAVEEPETFGDLPAMMDASSVTKAHRELRKRRLPHVSYNTGNNEWYTPPEYIEAVTSVMGCIDLDPASTPEANVIVGATTFYTAQDNGLQQPWKGRVFMNPPYASELIPLFAEKMKRHAQDGDVTEAIVLVNNATETAWFNNLINVACAVCFPKGRIKFLSPDGIPLGMPLQGQAIIYIGINTEQFIDVFSKFGWIARLKL